MNNKARFTTIIRVKFRSFWPVKIIIVFLMAALNITASALPTREQLASQAKNKMADFVKKVMKKGKMTGLSIAIVDNKGVLWAEGFGYADKKRKISSTAETVYRAGSITKLFTATAAMQLQEQGVLDIHRPLKSYLPTFNIKSRHGNIEEITLANIMTHHSGLPTDYIDGMWSNKAAEYTALVERLDDEYTALPANFLYSYSNVGYTLLGHALKNAAKQPYKSIIHNAILSPLDMRDSVITPMISGPKSAAGYVSGKLTPELPLRDVPAGALNTNVLDMSHFIQMVLNNGSFNNKQILSKQSLSQMLEQQNLDVPMDFNFRIGYGWHYYDEVFSNRKIKAIGHSGGTVTHHSDMIILPGENLGVIVMANDAGNNQGVRAIAEEAITKVYKLKTGITIPKINIVGKNNLVKSSVISHNLSGTYMMSTLGAAYIKQKKDFYSCFFESLGTDLKLKKRKNSNYLNFSKTLLGFIPIDLDRLGEINFRLEELGGYELIIANDQGTEVIEGYKYSQQPINQAWLARTGEYRLVNQLEAEVLQIDKLVIEIKWDSLMLSIYMKNGNKKTAFLTTIDDMNSVFAGLGRAVGYNLLADSKEGKDIIHMTGLVFEKELK